MLLQEYKQLGFDTIELNVSSLEIPEETFLRFIRLVKSGGLKAKPHFQVKFNESDISPLRRNLNIFRPCGRGYILESALY